MVYAVIASDSEAIHRATKRKHGLLRRFAPRNDGEEWRIGMQPLTSNLQGLRMKIPALPFTVTDWSQVAVTTHPGETGEALWRTLDIGDLRVRMVEYSPGYLADHWCDRGHVLYVL